MRTLFVVLLSVSVPVIARADSFADCREVFIAPTVVVGMRKDVDAHPAQAARLEIRATSGKSKAVVLNSVSVGENPFAEVLAPLWPERGTQGAWVPVDQSAHVNVTVVHGAGSKNQAVLESFDLDLTKAFRKTGYDFFPFASDQVFALQLFVASTDGTRNCKGLTGDSSPQLRLPVYQDDVTALPSSGMLAALRTAYGCDSKASASHPVCRSKHFYVDVMDVDRDGRPDAVIKQGRLMQQGEGTGMVGIWMLTPQGGFQPAFHGVCPRPAPVSPGVLWCETPERTSVIEFRDGRGTQRPPNAQEQQRIEAMQAHGRMSEAKANLKALSVAQLVYRNEKGRYGTELTEIGFEPERGNYYSYFLFEAGGRQKRDDKALRRTENARIIEADTRSGTKAVVASSPKEAGCSITPVVTADGKAFGLGVHGTAPNEFYVAAAVGNIDSDSDFDCWSISSMARKAANGTTIPAGSLFHEKSDSSIPDRRNPAE